MLLLCHLGSPKRIKRRVLLYVRVRVHNVILCWWLFTGHVHRACLPNLVSRVCVTEINCTAQRSSIVITTTKQVNQRNKILHSHIQYGEPWNYSILKYFACTFISTKVNISLTPLPAPFRLQPWLEKVLNSLISLLAVPRFHEGEGPQRDMPSSTKTIADQR